MTLTMIAQWVITLCGISSSYIMSCKQNPKWKYGPLIGLCGQPFWFYFVYSTQAWGLVPLTLWFTFTWIRGVKNYWFCGEQLVNTNGENNGNITTKN